MESNMDGGNDFLLRLTTMDFSTGDSIHSSNMETEHNAEAVLPDIPVVAVVQTPELELDLFGLKWKFDTVARCIDGASAKFLFNGLLPYDMHGNPVFLTFQLPEEQSSEPGRSSSHQVAHQEEPIEIVQDQNNEISRDENITTENIIPENIVNDAEIQTAVASIVNDENRVVSTVVSNENDQRPHTSLENQQATQRFNSHIFKNGQFAANDDNQRNSRAALTFSAQKINNSSVAISQIIEDNQGSRRKYICQFCRISYPQLHKWKRHVKIHIGKAVTICTCPECGIPYRDCRTARRHHNGAYRD